MKATITAIFVRGATVFTSRGRTADVVEVLSRPSASVAGKGATVNDELSLEAEAHVPQEE